jgi:hypothetical protein
VICVDIPIALSGGAGVDELVGGAADSFSSLSVIVDVEADLDEKMEGGPRWVSFNSRAERQYQSQCGRFNMLL